MSLILGQPAPVAPAPQQTAPPPTAASAGGAPPPTVPQAPAAGTPNPPTPEQSLQQRLSDAVNAQVNAPTNPAAAPTGQEFQQIQQLKAQLAAVQQQAEQQQMLMQQWQPHLQAAAALARQQQLAAQQVQPATAPVAAQSPTGVPQFDRSLMAYLSRDDKGQLQAAPGAPPGLVQQYEQYSAAFERFMHGLATDPVKALADPIGKLIEERAAAVFAQQQAAYESKAFVNGYVQRNADALWAKDAGGKFLTDMAGNKVLTDTGRLLLSTVNQITQSGVSDGRAALEMAHQLVNSHLQARSQQPAAAQTPPPVVPPAIPPTAPNLAAVADQVRQQWVAGAAANPAGPATQPSLGQPPVAGSPDFQPRPGGVLPSFQAMLAQAAAAAGIPGAV